MTEKLKVATIVGTRPEIIRLSRVISHFDEVFDHTLIHTSQNYDFELNEIFFNDLDLRKPDIYLDAAGESAGETIGQIISKSDHALKELQPDAVVILGDTNSSLSAIAAKRQKIPVFHMEAGNRCFDQRVPEEINRRIVDNIADLNLTYSSIAREYLLAEGFPADRIIKTGSPMFEVLAHYKQKIDASSILENQEIKENFYFLVSAHREENIEPEESFSELSNSLREVAERYELPVIVSTHPRTRNRIEASGRTFPSNVHFMKPLSFTDYVRLQIGAKAVLSDSGTISEESSILNFKALNIRKAHERPEAMEEGSVMMVGVGATRILQGLEMLDYQTAGQERNFLPVADYSMPNVSKKVARIILSYTDYIRQTIWRET